MLVARLVGRLRAAGRLNDTLLVVASDHGHSPITTALYPEAVLGPGLWSAEGGALHVADVTGPQRDRLGGHGIRPLDGSHLPPGLRDRVTTFVAPAGAAFERISGATTPSGPPVVVATHGNAPGTPGDVCVAFLAGGGAARGTRPHGSLRDLAPAIREAVGLPTHAGDRSPNALDDATAG
jgi:predicted AlkP superfamily pyrophosphatase or phosphodiesterase